MNIQKFINELHTACNLCGKNGVTIMLSNGIDEATIHIEQPVYVWDEVCDLRNRDTVIVIDDCCVDVHESGRLSKPTHVFASRADYIIDF